jgi:hypothetical protein
MTGQGPRARHLSRGDAVMGLIASWGTVAVHGEEGFRPQRAAILCQFSDSISKSWLDSCDPAQHLMLQIVEPVNVGGLGRLSAIRRTSTSAGVARDAGNTSSPAAAGFRERR